MVFKTLLILYALSLIWKANISFVTTVCPSVPSLTYHLSARKYSTPSGHYFHSIKLKDNYWLSAEKIKFWIKFDDNNGYFIWRPVYVFLLYLPQFFLNLNSLRQVFRECKEKYIVLINFFWKLCPWWDNSENMAETGRAETSV